MARRLSHLLLTGAATCASAVWVSVCAAAPEFIWQGLRMALSHLTLETLLSALLVGLVLAFFVEPLMERLHHLSRGVRHQTANQVQPSNALFVSGLALAFALVSICLHDALLAFVAGGGGDDPHGLSGVVNGFMLTIAWALVPFATALAWPSAHSRALAVPMAVLGGLSPLIAGWLFSWSPRDIVTTMIPCSAILALGYREIRRRGAHRFFARGARSVIMVAVTWLAVTLLFDFTLRYAGLARFAIYEVHNFWVDMRFYVGWAVGLLLAPPPPSAGAVDTRAAPSVGVGPSR